jgi:hypothetical protein
MKRFETAHEGSPSAAAPRRLLKAAPGRTKKSGARGLSQSRSQDDILPLKNEASPGNLAAIKLHDFSKGYKAPLTRQDSFDDLNDREQYVPRRELSAARRARQLRG